MSSLPEARWGRPDPHLLAGARRGPAPSLCSLLPGWHEILPFHPQTQALPPGGVERSHFEGAQQRGGRHPHFGVPSPPLGVGRVTLKWATLERRWGLALSCPVRGRQDPVAKHQPPSCPFLPRCPDFPAQLPLLLPLPPTLSQPWTAALGCPSPRLRGLRAGPTSGSWSSGRPSLSPGGRGRGGDLSERDVWAGKADF